MLKQSTRWTESENNPSSKNRLKKFCYLIKTSRRKYDIAFRIKPIAEIYYNLASVLKDMEDFKGARQNCAKALALMPGYIEAQLLKKLFDRY